MWNYAFVFFVISKTYKIYDINLTLRKLKGRMTKVIRFLYVYRSLESLLSKRPIYIQIRALALAFQLARAPRRAFWDVGAQRRNPSIRTNQTQKWTKFCGS